VEAAKAPRGSFKKVMLMPGGQGYDQVVGVVMFKGLKMFKTACSDYTV